MLTPASHIPPPRTCFTMPPAETAGPDPDFSRRWTAWLADGIAHERLVRQRAIVVAVAVGLLAVATTVAYTLLAS
jgi:hypothetical protein